MMKWIKPLAITLILAGVLLAGLYGADLRRSAALADQIRQLRNQAITITTTTPATIAPSEPSIEAATEPIPGSHQSDPFAGLRNQQPATEKNPLSDLAAINPDLIGWISIAGTRIDYPIVKGHDNTFYLTHGFDRAKSRAGAIFMDHRNIGDGNDTHTIIYGHRMKDQSMFQNLLKFDDAGFYGSHREIAIDTLYGRKTYRVFAAYTTDTGFNYIQTHFDRQTHQSFLAEIRKRSSHAWDTDVTFDEPILTLSTCSTDFEDARFVVHAKRIS